MITRNFRNKVLTSTVGNDRDQKPFPDLARSQVYQVGNALMCGDGTFHYQVAVFSDTVLPASATFLFEATTTCAGTTDLEHWDECRTADSNLKVDDGSFETIWFDTNAWKGFYASNTAPEGYRQNERVIRTIDASSGSLLGTTVLDGDTYGGAWSHHVGSVSPSETIIVSSPGIGHAFWCIPASLKVTDYFDTFLPPPVSTIVRTPGKIIKVNTSAGLGTEVTLSDLIIMDAACVDPLTGDLWVAMHDQSATTSTTSAWVLNRYDSSLALISSTVLTDYLTCIAFSNFGGVPIVYCEQNGTSSTTLRRFDVGTLSFLSNVTVSNFGTFHIGHGGMTVDSVGGYLYRTSAFSSTNRVSAYRLSDFALLGPCTTSPYGWRGSLCGPVLTSDNGKLYANGIAPIPPFNTRSFTGCWEAPYYGLVGFPTAYQGDITSIEEDWELQIDTPLSDQGSPVVRQRFMVTTDCGTFYTSTVRVGPYGGQVELKNWTSLVTTTDDTTTQNTPSTNNELITWTTKFELSGASLITSVPSASSATIPDLNTITTSATPTLAYIGDFDPAWSITGFTPGGLVAGTTALQGSELFFDNCQGGVTYFRRTSYRIYLSNAVIVTPSLPDTITNPWPACVANDLDFVISYFAGIKAVSVFIDQTPKIGYFVLQDVPNVVNKVDLVARTVLATAVVPALTPFAGGFGEFDPVGQDLYFPAKVGLTITPTSTDNVLAFNSSNVAHTVTRGSPNSSIYTVNLATGALTLLGTPPIPTLAALVFDGADLYGISGAGTTASNLYQLNPLDGSIITAHPYSGYDHITSLARRPSDGVLFGWVNGDPAGLVTISKVTGLATSIGGVSTNISDMTFHPLSGILYAVNPPASAIRTVDTSTGALTTVLTPLPSGGVYALAWDFQGTPVLWFKYDWPVGTLTTINTTSWTVNGPLLAKLDAGLMTVTLGDNNADVANANVAVFDIANDFGYLAFTKIYKYQLSTLAIVNTLDLSADPTMFTAAIDTVGGFAYFVHDNVGSGVKITKVDLGSFTVSATTTITPTSIPDIKAAVFMNGFLYLIDVTGFVRKISPALAVITTLQIPKTPAQAAYTVSFSQVVPVLGQLAIDPVNNHIYVGINNLGTGTALGSAIYEIEATGLTIFGSLYLDTFFEGFNNIQATALRNDGVGYGMTNTNDGNVIEFGEPPPEPVPHYINYRACNCQFG